MNKQELIEKIENLNKLYGERHYVAIDDVLNLASQLDEPQKPVVSQLVADWIDVCKENLAVGLHTALNPNFVKKYSKNNELIAWVRKHKNQETFAHAWIFGYEVKKEKRYEVILCNGQSLKAVYRQGSDYLDFEMVYGTPENFTKKQLEEAGFGWVFDCEGVEIEEVQDDSKI